MVLVSGVSSCDTPNGPPCVADIPSSPDATVPYATLRAEVCHFFARCHPAYLGVYSGGTEQACTDARDACVSWDVDAGQVTQSCLDAVRNAPCGAPILDIAFGSSLCALGGPIPEAQAGEICGHYVCRGDGLPPTPRRCAAGLECSGFHCRRLARVGERCSPFDGSVPCDRGLHCDGYPGVCQPDLPYGSACEWVIDELGVIIADPCDESNTCEGGVCASDYDRAVDGADLDGPCNPRSHPCAQDLVCSRGVCRAPVCSAGVSGDPCLPGRCRSGLFCNPSTAECEPFGSVCKVQDTPDDPSAIACPSGRLCMPTGGRTNTCQTYFQY